MAMINNEERLDPLGDDPASEEVRAARSERSLTALDEGQAWRRRRDGALAVVRAEVFASADDAVHRAAWRARGAESLDATWRARWRERDQVPGWIEARPRTPDTWPVLDRRRLAAVGDRWAEAIDWFGVEDHTDRSGSGQVICYQHLTVWAGRAHGTLTVRHALGSDLSVEALAAAGSIWGALSGAG